jgi:hypothetical protein
MPKAAVLSVGLARVFEWPTWFVTELATSLIVGELILGDAIEVVVKTSLVPYHAGAGTRPISHEPHYVLQSR